MSDFYSRLGTNVVLRQQRDPRAFKSGFGDALGSLGQVAFRIGQAEEELDEREREIDHEIRMKEEQRQRSHHIADRMGAWADTQVQLKLELDELRKASDPGAPGYDQKADALVTKKMQTFLGTLAADDDVQNRFGPMVAGFSAKTKGLEIQWAREQRAEFEGQQVDKFINITANENLKTPTPEALQAAIQATNDVIDGLDMDGNAKAERKRAAAGLYVTGMLDSLIASGQVDQAEAILANGIFDEFLDADRKEKQAYGRKVEIEREQAARQAEIEASAARSEILAKAKAMEARADAGEVFSSSEIENLRAGMKAAGVDIDEIVDFELLIEKVAENRQSEGKSAEQLQREVRELENLVANGNAKNVHRRTLRHRQRLLKEANSREAGQYKELLEQGAQGRMQILAQLPGQADVRFEQAEEVEKGLGVVSQLPRGTAARALRGRALRKDRKADFGTADEVRNAFNAIVGNLGSTLGDRHGDMMNLAWDIYAESMNESGVAGFHENAFAKIVNLAFGATKNSKGQMQGGIASVNRHVVELPDDRTAEQFARQLARKPFTNAVYADGRAAEKRDILKHYRPILTDFNARGRPVYTLIDGRNRPLKIEGGGNYEIVID